MLYAVVDIETTGGTPTGSRITEICVVVTNGSEVLQRFETLLDPGIHIPSGITALTGITNQMVEGAPSFASIAGDLYHLLHDKLFVAHNVNFDYGFIQKEFQQVGQLFSIPKVCSAKAARKAFPGRRSYSLGNICSHLGIEIKNRHRAGGDADATAELLHLIIETAGEELLLEMAGSGARQLALPPHIDAADIEKLPASPGVYYFLGTSGKPLYTGKAINIKKRVLQHFDIKRGKTALQLEKIRHVDFEETGSELMALLAEAEAINRLWPEWNVAGKVPHNRFALVHYATTNGEIRIQTARRNKSNTDGIPFSRLSDARNTLAALINQFGICASRAYSNKGCDNPDCYCNEIPEKRLELHNSKIITAIESLKSPNDSFLILCQGRNFGETGVVHVEDGLVRGWGFTAEISSNPNPELLVKKVKDIPEIRAIANSFVQRISNNTLKGYKIVPLNNNQFLEPHSSDATLSMVADTAEMEYEFLDQALDEAEKAAKSSPNKGSLAKSNTRHKLKHHKKNTI